MLRKVRCWWCITSNCTLYIHSDNGDTLSTVSALSSQEISTSTVSSRKGHTSPQPNSDNINVTVIVTGSTENPPRQENSPKIVQPARDSSWDR